MVVGWINMFCSFVLARTNLHPCPSWRIRRNAYSGWGAIRICARTVPVAGTLIASIPVSAPAPDGSVAETRLTAFSHGAGCACKLGPDELSQVLAEVRHHPAAQHPDLIVGIATGDDAGVFRLGDGTLLVQTTDFFTPIVDDAYDWGRVAAANALSDVYAMGGRPLSALQLVAWPREGLPSSSWHVF